MEMTPHQVIFSFTHFFLSLVSGKFRIKYIYCLSSYTVSSMRARATDLSSYIPSAQNNAWHTVGTQKMFVE